MKFRKAVQSDVKSIMNIIKQAQTYFKEHGINQWQCQSSQNIKLFIIVNCRFLFFIGNTGIEMQ